METTNETVSHRSSATHPRTGKHWAALWRVTAAAGWLAGCLVLNVSAAEPKSQPGAETQAAAMKVPPGFVVERVAGPPLVERPMLAGFDDRGRLYVADSAGVNLRGAELAKNPPHVIRMLEDTDGDGVFDKSTVFADKMVFPQGVVWHDGAVYASSPPSFWRLTDTDGDGVADKREELVTGFANTGVADDMHGGSLGPDGRVYWCAGRFPHEIRKPGGPVIHKGTAPLVLRCRPDGSDVEVVCGSQGNAVGVAFNMEGDFFASGTFLAPDSMGPGLRDALIHCVDGAEYPVRDRILNEHKRTGEVLPPLAHLGVSASSDLTLYRGDVFAAEYRGNLFSALFNMHKIVRHVLERDGATFRCRNIDFLVSANPDFHPTDVLEDADGSLLVVDTGGWFRIGCPTSQIAKPEVKGAIYRVRREGAPRVADPRGASLEWDAPAARELVRRLDDPRFAVVDRAIGQLAKLGNGSVSLVREALTNGSSVQARLGAVWAVTRTEGPDARAAVRVALSDRDSGVRQAAARSAGLHRDGHALARLTDLVKTDTPPVRREAATALGRIRRAEAVPALLEALRPDGDRFLEHALIFALIQINDRELTAKGLTDSKSKVRRGALIALDQMDAGKLTAEVVTPFLDPSDPLLQQTALWIIAHRPDWAKEMLGLVRQWLAQERLDERLEASLRNELFALANDGGIQDVVAAALRQERTPTAMRVLLMEAIAGAPIDKLPPTWAAELRWGLDHSDGRVVRQALATLHMRGVTDFDEALVRLARDEARPADVRLRALAAAAPRVPRLEAAMFEFLSSWLSAERPPLERLTAADALGHARLSNEQLVSLAQAVAVAGPLELPKILPAYEHKGNEEVGRKLVAALSQSAALRSVSAESLRRTLAGYPAEVRQQADPLVKQLVVDAEKQAARLAELEPAVAHGEAAQGREVFFGTKAACTTCHSVRSQGGRIGPDLSTIGAIRTGRDLLEAIVFPSASLARGYEPYVIATPDGRVQSGIIARETADAISLVTPERVEIRVPRASIEAIQQSPTSIMPQGLDTQLSRQELGDLIAFLQSLK